jgi:hypothetical protein
MVYNSLQFQVSMRSLIFRLPHSAIPGGCRGKPLKAEAWQAQAFETSLTGASGDLAPERIFASPQVVSKSEEGISVMARVQLVSYSSNTCELNILCSSLSTYIHPCILE